MAVFGVELLVKVCYVVLVHLVMHRAVVADLGAGPALILLTLNMLHDLRLVLPEIQGLAWMDLVAHSSVEVVV